MRASRHGDVDYLQGGFFLEKQAQFLSCVSVTGRSLGSKRLSTIPTPRRCAMQRPRKLLAVWIIKTVAHFISFPKVQIQVACWHIQLIEAAGMTATILLHPLCCRGGFSKLRWHERGTGHWVGSRILLLQGKKTTNHPCTEFPIGVWFGPDDVHALGFSRALTLPFGAAQRWHPRRNQRSFLLSLNTSVLVEAPSQLLAYLLKLPPDSLFTSCDFSTWNFKMQWVKCSTSTPKGCLGFFFPLK